MSKIHILVKHGVWILTTGFWNDGGVWVDNLSWVD